MKNDFNLEQVLTEALSVKEVPDERLNRKIMIRAKETNNMSEKRRWRVSAAALAAVFTLVIGSVSVYAALKYLTPENVAEELNDKGLAEAFNSEGAIKINETQVVGNMKITLLGVVSGKNLSERLQTHNGNILEDRTYIVTSIENADGTERQDGRSDDSELELFFISPFIKGLNPNFYNAMTLNGGCSTFVQDGIQYQLSECNNVEIFADRGLYIGVNDGPMYNSGAYCFDEVTGEISANPEYEGVSAVFSLPIDESRADKEAAQKCIDEIESKFHGSGDTVSDEEKNGEAEASVIWTKEKLAAEAELLPDTVQVLTPDDKGMMEFSFEIPDEGMSGAGTIAVSECFPDNKPGISSTFETLPTENGYNYIVIFELDEDGTITLAIYKYNEKLD